MEMEDTTNIPFVDAHDNEVHAEDTDEDLHTVDDQFHTPP